MTESGDVLGPRSVVDSAAELARWVPGRRWLWDAAPSSYPALFAAGVRVDRCYDVTLTERILLSREGRFGAPSSAAAVHARAAGLPVPPDPGLSAVPAQPMLFDSGGSPPEGPVVDPLEVLRVALVDQRRRIGADRALALLVAAESASGLAAVEMGRTGLPWRADIHVEPVDPDAGSRNHGRANARRGWRSSPPRSTPRSGSRSIPTPRSTCGPPSAAPGSTSTAPGRG